jgi:hypothetical protein
MMLENGGDGFVGIRFEKSVHPIYKRVWSHKNLFKVREQVVDNHLKTQTKLLPFSFFFTSSPSFFGFCPE